MHYASRKIHHRIFRQRCDAKSNSTLRKGSAALLCFVSCLPAGDATAMRERKAPAPAGHPRRTVTIKTTARGWRDDRRGIVKLCLHACRTELLSLSAGRRCSQSQYERSGRQSESEFCHKTSP